jgi:hypothetical protein
VNNAPDDRNNSIWTGANFVKLDALISVSFDRAAAVPERLRLSLFSAGLSALVVISRPQKV